MAISLVNSNMLSVSIDNSLVSESAARSEVHDSMDIEEQLQKNLHESVDFQIITKMLSNMYKEEEHRSQFGINKESIKKHSTEEKSFAENTNSHDTVSVSEQAVTSFVREKEQEQMSLSITRSEEVQQGDPLALDLNGDGLRTTEVDKGILFDINGDGSKERMSFRQGKSIINAALIKFQP